jgi:hypothetical protein
LRVVLTGGDQAAAATSRLPDLERLLALVASVNE